MNICIVGAGALGGHLAARLLMAGTPISVFARGATLHALKTRGLFFSDPEQERRFDVQATDDPNELGQQDVVILAVKAQDVSGAVASIRPLLSNTTRIVAVLNGIPWWYGSHLPEASRRRTTAHLDPGGIISKSINPQQVIGAVAYSLCNTPGPGEVHVGNKVSRLVLGEINGQISPEITQLAEILRSDAMNVEISPDIGSEIWAKLILLFATCPLAVLTSTTSAEFLKHVPCELVSRQLIAEGVATASALGHFVNIDADKIVASSKASAHRPSILQDLDRNRAMEIDALFSAPLELAQTAGISVPMLSLMTAMVQLRATAAGLYQ